jgi:hypothetical protein
MERGILRNSHNIEPSDHNPWVLLPASRKGRLGRMSHASGSPEHMPVPAARRRRRLGIVLPVVFAVPAVLGVGAAAYSRGLTNVNHTRPAAVAEPLDPARSDGAGAPGIVTPVDPPKRDEVRPAATASRAPGAITDRTPAPVSVSIGKLTITKDNTGVPQTSLPIAVTNTGSLTHSFDVTIVALDDTGRRITTDTGTAANLRPGQTAQLRVLEIVNDALVHALTTATFQVQGTFAY